MATLQELEDALITAGESGNTKATESISDAMRAHPTFQRNAMEKLNDGSYKVDKNYQKLDKDAERSEMSKLVARSMGLRDSEVDVTQGMGTYGRFKLSFQPTEQDKVKHLEDTYGRENIRAVDIGGKMKLLYRDEQETGNQFRAVDEEGTSLADFFGDTAGSALPIAGAIGAAAATGGASIPLTALAAAGGGFAASAGQDVAVRAGSGEDIRLGEIAKRRGIEAAIGVPIDLVTGVGGKFVSKAIGKRAIEKGAASLTKEIDDITTRLGGGDVRLTAAQETSTDKSLEQSIRAGIDPEGREAAAYGLQRDEIGKLSRILRGEDVGSEPIEDVMDNVSRRQFKLIDAYEQRVKQLDARKVEADALAKNQTKAQRRRVEDQLTKDRGIELQAMRDQAEQSIKKMTKGRQRLESTMGGDIREQQRAGQVNTEATSKGLYDEFYRRVDTQQAHTPISKIEDALKGIDDSRLIPDSPEMRGLQSLRKRVSDAYAQDPALRKPDFLDFKDLDGYIRDVTDGIRYNKTHGFKQSEKSLQDIGRRLDAIRDEAMSKPKKLGGLGAGTEAKKAYKKAQAHYKNKVLPFFDGDRAANLGRVAGGSSEAVGARGKNVVARTFATREAVKDALDSGVSRDTLKQSYLDKIVNEANGGEIKFDRDVLAELYSSSKDAASGKRIGAAKTISDLDRINDAIRRSNGSSTVSSREIDEALGEFEPKARAKKLRAIDEKGKAQEKLKKARNNFLAKVGKGEVPAPEDIHHFVGDISNLRPGQIKKLKSRLPSDRARASLERSGYDALLEKAGAKSAKAQRTGKGTGREALWEPETMHTILNNSAERAQWESLIGKEAVRDIETLNKWLLSSAEIRDTAQESIGRFVTSTGASGTPNMLFVSPQLPRWIGRKMLSIIHTSPLTRGMMKRSLKESKVDQDTINKLFYTAMGTRRGMDAITDEMAKDPAFSAYVQESMKDQPQE